MLFGRESESARIDELLDAARERRSAALVVRGEAGIGKSALLDAAVERAGDMRVFRAVGVESEVEIPFSGLHQLLRPALACLDALPKAQAVALRSALALAGTRRVDRLAAFAGTLSLLAAAADEQPLLCAIDDAHWLDDVSAAALTFAARRLDADGIAMLFGVREPDVRPFAARGVPELRLTGLDRTAARSVVGAEVRGAAPLVIDEIVELAGGNPLALIELPRALTAAELRGAVPLRALGRGATAAARGFLRRVARLSASARRALLVVAASDVTDVRAISRALAGPGLDATSLEPAEAAGLIAVGSTVDFCHPLLRTAIYEAAEEEERREAHLALAAAADAAGEPDRRAWHLAASTREPDEAIASALVAAAESARRRGGVWAEAKALERAARITPEPAVGASRLARSGDAAYRAGRVERADALLQEAVTAGLDPREFARAQARRAYIRLERGELDAALTLMVGGADALEASDARAAATLLTNAATVLYHRLEIAQGTVLAERAWRLAGDDAMDDPELSHIVSFQRLLVGSVREAMALAWHCADLVQRDPDGRIVVADAASTLLYGGEVEPARRLFDDAVRADRAAGALGDLGYTLHMSAQAEWYAGDLDRAYLQELEAAQIVDELGTRQVLDDCHSRLAMFEAALGREDDSRGHAERALGSSLRLGDRRNEIRARGALGLLALSTGDAEAAVTQLAPAVAALQRGGHRNPNHFRLQPDLVEAYVRLGRPDEAEPIVALLESQARATRITWTLGAAARCRALVTQADGAADALFGDALELHGSAGTFEHARTRLCFGEHLRRRGLRRASRRHLAAALEAFELAGARPWAERARAELRASGQTVRRREPAAPERLTPQELQIARLVADGKGNREIAASLFVSPKTVEFHLTRIYRKLEIHSRSELVRQLPDRRAAEPGASSAA